MTSDLPNCGLKVNLALFFRLLSLFTRDPGRIEECPVTNEITCLQDGLLRKEASIPSLLGNGFMRKCFMIFADIVCSTSASATLGLMPTTLHRVQAHFRLNGPRISATHSLACTLHLPRTTRTCCESFHGKVFVPSRLTGRVPKCWNTVKGTGRGL